MIKSRFVDIMGHRIIDLFTILTYKKGNIYYLRKQAVYKNIDLIFQKININ